MKQNDITGMEQNNSKKSTQFWRQVSNGLRDSLNVIKGTADIAQNEIYDIETVKDGFEKIGQSSEFLINVVNDIVDFVAIENREIEIAEDPFDFKEMIEWLVAKYYSKAASEDKHFDVQIHGVTHEKFRGDKRRVEQILDCMIINSLKYTGKNDNLNFRIFENGIAENKINIRFTLTVTNRIMYDYLCGTVNNKIVTEATDLALYNCHYILKQMGGRIEVDLDDENTSEIIIDMSFGLDNDSAEEKDVSLFDSQNILIICDNKQEAEERGQLLKEMNVSYKTATDAEEALEMIGAAEEEGKAFSICVLDWNIRNFKLQNFVNDVHSIFGKTMPLVAMAYNDKNVQEQALEIGFDYVMKGAWFRSTVCDILMKNTKGQWKQLEKNEEKQYNFEHKHILVAEDAVLNREFIVRILTNVQAEVECTVNGMEAYNLYRQRPENYFDCIILDVNMPQMNGYEATSKIRNCGRSDSKTVPIFALTANAFQTDIRQAMEVGMNGHFSKPVDIDRLYKTLENIFWNAENGNAQHGQFMEGTNEGNEKSDTDELTGVLSIYGLEKALEIPQFRNSPIGFLIVEANNYEEVLDTWGQFKAEDLLHSVAACLKEVFRNTDIIARYGPSCFAVVVDRCDQNMTFVGSKVREINNTFSTGLEHLRGGISVGASYSAYGYSPKLVSRAYEALDKIKEKGVAGCYVLKEQTDNIVSENLLNRFLFGEEMFNFGGTNMNQIDKIDEMLTLLLGNNQAVGIMCGNYKEGLEITSASGFALKNLGYDPEDFVKTIDLKLQNLIYEEDLKVFTDKAPECEMEVRKLRLKHKNGNALWFNAAYINVYTKKKQKMWIASFRPFDENMVGRLCDMDYQTVSIIFPKENAIILEKGVDVVYNVELKIGKKYDYESLVKKVLVQLHKDSEKQEYLYNTSIENIVSEINNKGVYEFISYQVQKDKHSVPLRYKYRYLDGAKDTILWTLESVEGIAEGDSVTSLLNEKGFYRKVKQVFEAEENARKQYVIIYFNIKDFKSCNEVLGYNNGNMLLRQYAEMIKASKLKPVYGARFHADQFCFLIEKENLDYQEIISLCLRKMIIRGNAVNVRSHCGIYHVEDKEQKIVNMCDKAVLATGSITNEYAMPYFEFDETVNQEYQNKLFVLNNLDRAFLKDEFQVFYQPVCDTKTGKICSAEALVRWVLPGGKFVSPGEFIPVMEKKGFISRLDLLVADKVQQFLERRSFMEQRIVPVSVNLSRMDFLNETFLKDLMDHVETISIDRSLFRYEVTESAYINVGQDGKGILDELRRNKSYIYIDDFGTGYSSLQNLMEIHFDVLKLDMYFIRKIGQSPIAEGIIDAAIKVCHSLSRKVIAEGVETEKQYQFLKERDCDYIQGYYFYKPVSEQEFAKLLDDNL